MPAGSRGLRRSLTEAVTICEMSKRLLRGGRETVPKILFKSGHFKFEENSNLVCVEFALKYRLIANGGFKPVC
jgi:hypothetical protein